MFPWKRLGSCSLGNGLGQFHVWRQICFEFLVGWDAVAHTSNELTDLPSALGADNNIRGAETAGSQRFLVLGEDAIVAGPTHTVDSDSDSVRAQSCSSSTVAYMLGMQQSHCIICTPTLYWHFLQ